jgi:hypothetical protein
MLRVLSLYIKFIAKRLLFAIFWTSIFMLFFILKPNEILYFNINDYINLNYKIAELDTWLYTVHVLMLIFILLIIVETLYIVFYSWYKTFSENQKTKIYNQMKVEVFAYLAGEINDIKEKKAFWTFAKIFYSEQMLRYFVDGLREVILLTKGKVYNRCISIFVLVRVKKLIEVYMRSPYIKHRAYAIRSIGEFQLKEHEDYLIKYLNSKNSIYRSEALQSYLEIKKTTDLSFLLDRKAKLSKWDYNIIIKYGKHLGEINYDGLLASKRPDLLLVALKFIQINDRFDYKAEVIELLKSDNTEVEEEAYITFSMFLENDNEVQTLIYKYNSFTPSTQSEILNVIAGANYTEAVSSFMKWLVIAGSMTEKTMALETFLRNDMPSFLKCKENDDPLIAMAYKQVTDFNLLF